MTDKPLRRSLKICNKRGLHARASAKFVQIAAGYDADVKVEKGGIIVGGDSIMGLMMLAAAPGCTIRLSATGRQAEDVLQALEDLVRSRFGEEN